MVLLTLQESLASRPAQRKCSTIPPGAAGPYLALHSEFFHIGMLTSCKILGCCPPVGKHKSY